jgi:uncharacterized protein
MKSRHHRSASEKDRIIERISDFLLTRHKEIIVAYSFGSFLSSEVFSDIDLGLLLHKTPAEPMKYEINLESELENSISHPVDIRILNEAPISFCQATVRGKVILDRDPNRRADFENRVLKEYFDFSTFRRRYLAEVLNAPV